MSIKQKIVVALCVLTSVFLAHVLFDLYLQKLLIAAALRGDDAMISSLTVWTQGGTAVFIALFVVISASIAWALRKSLVARLNAAVSVANALAVGYLENAIDTDVKGETGDLLRALAGLQGSQMAMKAHLERQISETESAYVDMEKSAAALNVANTEMAALNASMNTMMDALELGLFSFGADGVCLPVYSKACLSLLDHAPASTPVAELLKSSAEEAASIGRVLKMIFSEDGNSPTQSGLLSLLPDNFANSGKAQIGLSYHPIVDREGHTRSILAVATDHTAENEAMQLLKDRETEALRVLRISGNRNLFIRFYDALSDYFSNIEESISDHTSLERVRRDIHTFKGNASLFHLHGIASILHEIEDRMVGLSSLTEVRRVVRDSLPRLRAILTKVHKQAYDLLGKDFDQHGVTRTLPLRVLGGMADRLKALPQSEAVYKDFVSTLMGEPVRIPLTTFDIMLHELADRFGKRVAPCYFTGDNFLLLTENYSALFATFSHIARNIISHAIDTPELRAARHKDPELTVVIETKKFKKGDQDWLRICFEDDGGGIDVARLRQKINAGHLSNQDVMNRIFDDQLSTKEDVDELAGRGVGLSAVRQEAEKIGGVVAVESEWGLFTKIIIDAPFLWHNPQDRTAEAV